MTSSQDSSISRRDAQRKARRDAIVQVAARSFSEHGYAGMTMSSVAAKLGGSKGTLWSYFPSKEALFVAVLDYMTEDFRTQLQLILNPEHDVEDVLRRFCKKFVVKVTSVEGLALYRLIVAESARFPEIGRIFYERGQQQTYERVAAFLEGAMERGLLRRSDALVASRLLVGLCVAGVRQRQLIGLTATASAAEIAEDADAALDMFLHAYATG